MSEILYIIFGMYLSLSLLVLFDLYDKWKDRQLPKISKSIIFRDGDDAFGTHYQISFPDDKQVICESIEVPENKTTIDEIKTDKSFTGKVYVGEKLDHVIKFNSITELTKQIDSNK